MQDISGWSHVWMKTQICLGTAGVMLVKHLIGNAQLRALALALLRGA